MAIQNPVETLIGAAVLSVAIGFGVFAAQSDGQGVSRGSYEVHALFRAAVGVAPGTDVRIAGVKVGSVTEVELDPETFRARATLAIRDDIVITEDTLAKIDSEGLLGGSYIALEPGASVVELADGDVLEFTQGSVSLIDLVTTLGGSSSSSQ